MADTKASPARRIPFARYASWLDGETLKLNREDCRLDAVALVDEVQRGLKMAALMGQRVALTDIQLVDSPGIALPFADPQFLAFLGANPGWLLLFARPSPDDAALPIPESARRARAGLHRSQRDGWRSSSFPERTDEARAFHRWCLDRTRSFVRREELIETARQDGVLRRQEHGLPFDLRDELRLGMMSAIVHFGFGTPDDTYAPDAAPSDYCQILVEAMNSGALGVRDGYFLEKFLEYLETNIPDPHDRIFRSRLQRLLADDTRLSAQARLRMWRTAVFAWNCANARSIGAAGASYGPLGGALRIPAYLNEPVTELVLKSRYLMRPPETLVEITREQFTGLDHDFSRLTWEQVSRVCAVTQRQRTDYQEASETPTLLDDRARLSELLSGVADEMLRIQPALPPAADRLVTAAGLLGGLHPVSKPVVGAAKQAYGSMKWLARHVARYKMISTLRRFSESDE
jgi:hypothetical protein